MILFGVKILVTIFIALVILVFANAMRLVYIYRKDDTAGSDLACYVGGVVGIAAECGLLYALWSF